MRSRKPAPDQAGRPADGDLSSTLGAWLTGFEESRLTAPRLHLSSLYELCTRQRVLAVERGTPIRDVLRAPLRVRFDVGNAVHDLMREEYLGPMGGLYGDWRHGCGATAMGRLPLRCASCGGGGGWCYLEREIEKTIAGVTVVGHLDGMIESDAFGIGTLQIKSMESAVFRHKRLPLPAHVWTEKAYLWLTGLRWGRILYVSTGLEEKTAVRDYVVRYDVRVAAQIERILAEIAAGGQRACRGPGDARALACPVRWECFGGAA